MSAALKLKSLLTQYQQNQLKSIANDEDIRIVDVLGNCIVQQIYKKVGSRESIFTKIKILKQFNHDYIKI
jgi:hypothetical protein